MRKRPLQTGGAAFFVSPQEAALATISNDRVKEFIELFGQLTPEEQEESIGRMKAAVMPEAAMQVLLEEADILSQELWTWMIGQSPDLKDAAYCHEGLAMFSGGVRGYMHFNLPREKLLRLLTDDVDKARALVRRLEIQRREKQGK